MDDYLDFIRFIVSIIEDLFLKTGEDEEEEQWVELVLMEEGRVI